MKIKVKLNSRDAAKYLKDPSVRRMLDRRAQRGAAQLGPGYTATGYTGRRARAQVAAVSARARRDNSKNQSLLKVVSKL